MPDPSLTLNDNHRNTLLSGFKYIDRLLEEGLAGLAADHDSSAVFAPVSPDATPAQRKVITDQVARLRRAIRAALDAFAIPIRPPTVSALWSLRTHLDFVEVALEDLAPRHLRGYGEIDDPTKAGVEVALAQIRTVLTELDHYLAGGLGGDLATRISRLDQTKDEVALLRELERTVTAHGLAEFRQPLAHLLEKVERPRWTIALVGRVSCGKSSLLNFLLGTDVLPSGVTPVTAVPIRIVNGTGAWATVSFATGRPERVPAVQLAKFASEEENPGNSRCVTDILLELPVARLAGDVCFVDTPGLGSLATSGAAQTLAFLPRCDLGVLMIDAAATLTEEDITVARTLLENGAEVMIVVSKADLLATPDREKTVRYISTRLAAALGRATPVVPVSVAAGQDDLAETWWDEMMRPRLRRHRELAATVLRRKIGALREGVVEALSRRGGGPGRHRFVTAETLAPIGLARAAIENARRQACELSLRMTPPAEQVFAAVAAVLVEREVDDDLSAALAGELGLVAAKLAGCFDALIDETRALATQALTVALDGGTSPPVELSPASSRPLFDPAPVLGAGKISAAWRRWPAAAARRAALSRALRSRFGPPLDAALRNYGHALVGWTQHGLDDLAAQFNAQAGLVEAAVASSEPGRAGAATAELARDLERLRDWNARPAA